MVKTSLATEEAFEDLNRRIHNMDSLVIGVKEAMDEQKIACEQMLIAITAINEVTVTVRSSSYEMTSENQLIVAIMERLEQAAKRIAADTEVILSDIDKVEVQTKDISVIAGENGDLVGRMEHAIGSFKV